MADDNFPPVKDLERIQQIYEKISSFRDDEREANAEEIKALEKKANILTEIAVKRREAIKDIEAEMEALKGGNMSRKDSNRLLELQYEKNRLLTEEYKAQGKIKSQEREELDKENEKLEKQLENEKKRKQNKIDILGIVKAIGGQYTNQITQMMTLNGLVGKFSEFVQEVILANEKLAKTTGRVGMMNQEMAYGMESFGVGYREMAGSVGELYGSMSIFSELNKSVQTDLAANTAKMENLGVSAATSGKNYDLLNKSLKFNASEVDDISNKMAKHAIGAGIAPQKMLSEFSSAMPQLAAHGQKAVDIFIKMEKQSKMLGIELSSLMGVIGDGFDTFEGAADKAGKLNAALGGDYLNSVEMLNATESERIDLLRKSFMESGRSFESLERFEQKQIAGILGIKDMTQAQALLGSTSIEARLAMEAEAASQEELEDAQKASADTMRQLTLAFNKLLELAEPLARGLKTIITWMSEYPKITLFGFAIAALVGTFITFSGILPIFPALFAGLAAGVTALGAASTAGALPILALGAAILLIGGGIAVAAWGMSKLVESLGTLISGIGEKGGLVLMSIAYGVWALVSAITAFAAVGVLGIGFAGLLTMKKVIGDLIETINEIPSGVEFTTKVKSFSDIGRTLEAVSTSPEKMRPATEFVTAAKDFYVAQRASKDAENDSLVQAIKKIVTPAAPAGGEAGKEVPVRMKIENGPELRGWLLGSRANLIGK